MDRADAPARLRVSVVYSPRPREVDEVGLVLGDGATVADALRESGLQARHPGFDLTAANVGIWGTPCGRDQRLRDRDRVEVYRALIVDPKEARRLRYQAQRGKGAANLKR